MRDALAQASGEFGVSRKLAAGLLGIFQRTVDRDFEYAATALDEFDLCRRLLVKEEVSRLTDELIDLQ